MIAVTGASGKLGNWVIQELLKRTEAKNIVALVRDPQKTQNLQALGVQVRQADYEQYNTLVDALNGVEKLLLISSNEIGKRATQHQAVINAAVAAKVQHLAYTSVLNADSSTLGLSEEHRVTEKAILASGLKYTFLRNGWYLENHTENLASALQHGVILGAAGEGRFSSASRQDYATAAAIVLTQAGHENKIYEFAGNQSFTLQDLAKELSHQSQKKIVYQDMSEAEYEKALIGFGLPQALAHLLADSDTGAKNGQLESRSTDLNKLIGRESTTLRSAIQSAIKE